MAEAPPVTLTFGEGCPDCGERVAALPPLLPPVADDLDWLQRDYDSFRLAMMEELAARFPERRRFSPADMEVALVEALAVCLDQLSDMMDRVHAEAFLETARRPDGVLRLLSLIGYDPLPASGIGYDPIVEAEVEAARATLLNRWLTYPAEMEAAKVAGPRSIRRQRRMVSLPDYVNALEDHPLVLRATARERWTGSWSTISLPCICLGFTPLHATVDSVHGGPAEPRTLRLRAEIEALHRDTGIALPDWAAAPTLRRLIRQFVDAWRMAGQEVWLLDPEPVGILVDLTVVARDAFFRSEIAAAVRRALGQGPSGFFAPSRLSFGEDLFASDLIAHVMALEAVEADGLDPIERHDMGDKVGGE
ncbi:MAG: hypothetical protein AAFQ88_15280, partial [Pseudomonadota bacterium]